MAGRPLALAALVLAHAHLAAAFGAAFCGAPAALGLRSSWTAPRAVQQREALGGRSPGGAPAGARMALMNAQPENLGVPDEDGAACQLYRALRDIETHRKGIASCEVVQGALNALRSGDWGIMSQESEACLRAGPLGVLLKGFDDFVVDPERGRFKLELPGGGRYAVVEALVKERGGRDWTKLHWRLALDPAVGYWETDKIHVDQDTQWLREKVRPDSSENYHASF